MFDFYFDPFYHSTLIRFIILSLLSFISLFVDQEVDNVLCIFFSKKGVKQYISIQ